MCILALMLQTVGLLLLLHAACARAVIPPTGNIVQFLVFAERQSEVLDAFPGASVDYTWNNVFVVTVWSDDPAKTMPHINEVLAADPNLKVLVPPYTLDVATQRWLQYNLLWVAVLLLVFVGGCVCGGLMVGDCCAYKNGRRHR